MKQFKKSIVENMLTKTTAIQANLGRNLKEANYTE
jgi:hypothetical protein